MARPGRHNSSPLRALDETELPRRDSAIVVGVTAAIVGLLVLWMTQAGAVSRAPGTGAGAASAGAGDSSEIQDDVAEDSAAPTTIELRGQPLRGLRENVAGE